MEKERGELRPFVEIHDGNRDQSSPANAAAHEPVWLDVQADRAQAHQLALEVVPRESDARRFALRARWNGEIVHERDIQRLSAATVTPLQIELRAEGRPGSTVAVSFDDYRLVRRTE